MSPPDHPLLAHFARMARYNRLANQVLYEACSRLSDATRKQRRPAFFGSIHVTLNHILVGDRIWLARFENRAAPAIALDSVLYEAFSDLRAARAAEDAHIEAFVAGLDPAFAGGRVRYVNYSGKACDDPADLLLAHFFNHQTHHRGQVHDMLSQTELPPPSLDLHRLLRS